MQLEQSKLDKVKGKAFCRKKPHKHMNQLDQLLIMLNFDYTEFNILWRSNLKIFILLKWFWGFEKISGSEDEY